MLHVDRWQQVQSLIAHSDLSELQKALIDYRFDPPARLACGKLIVDGWGSWTDFKEKNPTLIGSRTKKDLEAEFATALQRIKTVLEAHGVCSPNDL